ncbi:hypothetical protein CBR_g41370 [Chara braunii]|uniref:Molybdopterin converting factor subunit 1 n=1 Tax=Chara braunii TaxID=69332 RepID=A0A388LVU2_CHABU|nr:hypothetical protein CBR_g41370 [Chara braunii]|eukprot:GBG86375.1 hypothetical protein CBR_g41370 [Chara braunii]
MPAKIKVRVLFFALVKELLGKAATTMELDEGTDTARLLQLLTTKFPALKSISGSVMIAVNREYVYSPVRINNGDEIAFFPPISGG